MEGGRAPGVAESGEIFRASGREGESDSPGNWKIEPASPPAPSRESLSEGSRGDIPFTRLPLRFGDTHGRASLCIDGDDNSDKNQWGLLILYLVEIYTYRRGRGVEKRINPMYQ